MRELDSSLQAALETGHIMPVVLAMLTFKSETRYVWSGRGDLVWDAMTFTGVGSLGAVGPMKEGTEVRADGTTLTLSGIDPVLLAECLTDIQIGAPAKIWVGLVDATMALIGAPYLNFSGQVDKPTHAIGAETCSISLALENRLVDHGRPSQRRWTAADQHANGYPDDTAFGWVESLNDEALLWGS